MGWVGRGNPRAQRDYCSRQSVTHRHVFRLQLNTRRLRLLRQQRREILLGVEPDADTGRHAPAAAGTLRGGRPRNLLHPQLLDLVAVAVAVLTPPAFALQVYDVAPEPVSVIGVPLQTAVCDATAFKFGVGVIVTSTVCVLAHPPPLSPVTV